MNEIREEMNANVEAHDIEIDFGRIFKSLLHFAWLIVLLAIIGAAIMFAYSKFIMPPEYKSTASVFIHDKSINSAAGGEIDNEESDLKYNTVGGNAVTYLKNTYHRTLVSDTTLRIVIENLGLPYSTAGLRGMIAASSSDYPYFDITVTANNPENAALIANELADVLYSQVAKIVGGSSLTHVDEATVPTKKSGPNTTLNTLIGFAAGLLLGCLIIVVIELANNKIYNDEYLTQKYGISVLASITDFEATGKKGYGYYKKYGKYAYYAEQNGGEE